MKEKGKAIRMYDDNPKSNRYLTSVDYDGRYVWFTLEDWDAAPEVRVLDPKTGRLWELTVDDGLPLYAREADSAPVHKIKAAAIAPGTAILAGGFGRSWLAKVEFDPEGKHRVNVFHEAREVEDPKFASRNDDKSPSLAFKPTFLLALSSGRGTDTDAGGDTGYQRVLVGRYGWNPLVFDPNKLSVSVLPHSWHYLDYFEIYRGGVYYTWARSSTRKMCLRRCDASELKGRPIMEDVPPGIVVMQGDTVNVLGGQWWRGRVADGKLESMGEVPWTSDMRRKHWKPKEGEPNGWSGATLKAIARSHHYGLLVSCSGGRWPKESTLAEVCFEGLDKTVQTGPFDDAASPSSEPREPELNDDDVAKYLAGTRAMSLSKDGTLMAVSYSTNALVLGTKDLSPVRLFSPGGNRRPIPALSPDGRRLVTATPRDSVQVWDVATGREIHRIPLNRGLTQVTFMPESKRFAVSGTMGVLLCDAETGDWMEIEALDNVAGQLQDGALVGSSSRRPRKLIAWHPDESKRRVLWDRLWGEPLAITPDGQWIFTWEYDGFVDGKYQMIQRLRAWDLATRKERPIAPSARMIHTGTVPINEKVTAHRIVAPATVRGSVQWFLRKKGGWGVVLPPERLPLQ
jgi:hypothetical protein